MEIEEYRKQRIAALEDEIKYAANKVNGSCDIRDVVYQQHYQKWDEINSELAVKGIHIVEFINNNREYFSSGWRWAFYDFFQSLSYFLRGEESNDEERLFPKIYDGGNCVYVHYDTEYLKEQRKYENHMTTPQSAFGGLCAMLRQIAEDADKADKLKVKLTQAQLTNKMEEIVQDTLKQDNGNERTQNQ